LILLGFLFSEKFFRKVGTLSYLSIFILVLLGGVVRSTGSGMGCPDWPKCFDRLVPPTCACQLPADVEARMAAKREQKLDKFANWLEGIGLGEKAMEIRKNPALRVHESFNPVKAWIEYINRLYGALTGFFVLIMLISATAYIKRQPVVFWFTLGGFILTFFNAWLGSKVVVTNLLPGLVSMHFMLSFAAVSCFIAAVIYAGTNRRVYSPMHHYTIWGGLAVLSLLQISLGALVRERVDMLELAGKLTDSKGWIDMHAMGNLFLLHRGLSMVVLGLHAWLWLTIRMNKQRDTAYFNLVNIIMFLFLLQISTGALNTMFPFPVIARTLHILAGSICFGIQAYLCILHFRLGRGGDEPQLETP
jgi:heme a synthase